MKFVDDDDDDDDDDTIRSEYRIYARKVSFRTCMSKFEKKVVLQKELNFAMFLTAIDEAASFSSYSDSWHCRSCLFARLSSPLHDKIKTHAA